MTTPKSPDGRYLLPCGCPAEPFRVGWNTVDKLVQCFGCGKEYGVKEKVETKGVEIND